MVQSGNLRSVPGRLHAQACGGGTKAGLLSGDLMMPIIDTKLTMGNIIQIGLLLFSMIMAFSQLATKAEIKAARDDFAQSFEVFKKEYVSREVNTLQLQMISNQVQAMNLKVEDVQKDMKDIKRFVK